METKEDKYKETVCCICLEEFPEGFSPLKPCGHYIHTECVYKSGKELCPICRVVVELTQDEKEKVKIYQKELRDYQLEQERREILLELSNEYFYYNIQPIFHPAPGFSINLDSDDEYGDDYDEYI
jgi:hypothetical protein